MAFPLSTGVAYLAVGEPAEQAPLWTVEMGRLLEQARHLHEHNQHECAGQLKRLGATCTQQTVSDWEKPKIKPPSPASLKAIRAYLMDVGLDLFGGAGTRLTLHSDNRIVQPTGGQSSAAARDAEYEAAIRRRVMEGPPFSDADLEMHRWLMEQST
jgi:hypothetical protein